jgi:hypothetical protein
MEADTTAGDLGVKENIVVGAFDQREGSTVGVVGVSEPLDS